LFKFRSIKIIYKNKVAVFLNIDITSLLSNVGVRLSFTGYYYEAVDDYVR